MFTAANEEKLGAIAWASGFDFWQLMAWDAAIFAACYVSYCAYLAYARVTLIASIAAARHGHLSTTVLALEFVFSFFDSAVYRVVYSWSDIAHQVPRVPGR